jgi:hypothetical protein
MGEAECPPESTLLGEARFGLNAHLAAPQVGRFALCRLPRNCAVLPSAQFRVLLASTCVSLFFALCGAPVCHSARRPSLLFASSCCARAV